MIKVVHVGIYLTDDVKCNVTCQSAQEKSGRLVGFLVKLLTWGSGFLREVS